MSLAKEAIITCFARFVIGAAIGAAAGKAVQAANDALYRYAMELKSAKLANQKN